MLALTLLGTFFLLIGFIKIRKSVNILDDLKRYEFENTADGGTIKFTSYEASKEHDINKKRAELVGALSLVSMFLGIVFLSIAFFIYTK